MRTGTKTTRSQAVLVNAHKHSHALLCLEVLCAGLADDVALVPPCALPDYQNAIRKACNILGLPAYTAHCPRAGFATDAYWAGTDFTSLREEGRWLNDAALRIYLDGVASGAQAASALA